jgi:hypothetical protein
MQSRKDSDMTKMWNKSSALRGFLLASSLLTAAPAIALDEPPAATPPVKVAARSIQTDQGAFTLGAPVVVSRSDVESPVRRVGSPEFNAPVENARVPDPAFKGVLLTPRESTGRPAQPNIGEENYQVASAPSSSADEPRPLEDHRNQRKGNIAPAPSRPTPDKPAGRQQPAKASTAAAPQPAKTATTVAPRRFGPAEIAATRAFTRF